MEAANANLTEQVANLEEGNDRLETDRSAVAGELRSLRTEHRELQENFNVVDTRYAEALNEQFSLEDERDAAVDSATACQDYLVATADVLADYKDLSTFFVTLLSGGTESIDMDYVRRLSDGDTTANIEALGEPMIACTALAP